MNLERKTLSELLQLRISLAGTVFFPAVDRELKITLSKQYEKMMLHCQQRDKVITKKYRRF